MSPSYYNAERYADPTAYEALRRIEQEEHEFKSKYRPLVYVCSPYAGDTKANIQAARRYCRFVASRDCVPFASHLLFTQFLNDKVKKERDLGMIFGRVMMRICKEIWVFGEEVTPGMKEELMYAKRKGFRIRKFTEELQEYD